MEYEKHNMPPLEVENEYYYGLGVEKDYTESMKWYKKAAYSDNEAAQWNLGRMYSSGLGVIRNGKEASKWFGMANLKRDTKPASLCKLINISDYLKKERPYLLKMT